MGGQLLLEVGNRQMTSGLEEDEEEEFILKSRFINGLETGFMQFQKFVRLQMLQRYRQLPAMFNLRFTMRWL
jgi:hypothetical protein